METGRLSCELPYSETGATYLYIQFEVTRLGEPLSHSGTKVMNPVQSLASYLNQVQKSDPGRKTTDRHGEREDE